MDTVRFLTSAPAMKAGKEGTAMYPYATMNVSVGNAQLLIPALVSLAG